MITSFGLSGLDWFLLALCAMIVGMAKTGVVGIYHLVVPVLAMIFGGKDSTGLLLPMLIAADIIAVIYYRRSAQWKHVFRVFPPALIGVAVATWVGQKLSDDTFKILMGIAVLIGLVIMVYMERRKSKEVPTSHWFGWGMGLMAGFATMIGNAAGPLMAVYLLAMRMPKNVYIGTSAWFFFLINLSKLPFHIFAWHTIRAETLTLGMTMIPVIGLGGFIGIWIVKHIPDRYYRYVVIAATAVSAMVLLW
ncbi:MAG: sulfite exporter TauE/SafE family protein [Bacteroidia bacterium]|nr:sulfite exporter TauE/SafE family protein [Bacteroidia bacterium]